MLTATGTTVKSPTHNTPQQPVRATAIDHYPAIFRNLEERLPAGTDQRQPTYQVEEALSRGLLAIGRALLWIFLTRSGDGDTGPTPTLPVDYPSEPSQVFPDSASRIPVLIFDLRRGFIG